MSECWRIIDSGPCEASYNMALDEAIALHIKKGTFPPTLRFYCWRTPSVSLGSFQRSSDVNIKFCKENRIPVVRRPTGGRAILHGRELTYSFSARTDHIHFSSGLLDSYRKISNVFYLTFKRLGLDVTAEDKRKKGSVLTRSPLCFHTSSFAEIKVSGRKLVGSAQKRWNDGLLQQGSIPYENDIERINAIFGREKSSGIMDYMITISDVIQEFNENLFKKNIILSFEEVFGISLIPSSLSLEESLLAEELLNQKYLQDSWNFRK